MDRVVTALKRIRSHVIISEYKLHEIIARELAKEGISFKSEVPLGPRNRIDFLTDNGIGIEAKKGKPNELQVLKQLERYAQFESVNGLILVIERYMDLPEEINGKPVLSIGLRKLWGIVSK
ncbi:hypothetical protein SD71_16045 [Cohnella kolymensis]|uniref:DUF4143 domain-containing protein n=1 Tax=Cohnella kolymensis TaxID=1590652 RepID=A0ABR5A247_9BACL|nr:hypothetical protein [Cohnella kolymensis]KIL35141.1 hypothetical protein SD71_16045 [Cohnella kolymensis]